MVHTAVGAGGGYNERDGLEYIDRDESDEEFDEVSTMYTCTRYTMYMYDIVTLAG